MPATARIDVGALSGALFGQVSALMAETIVRTIDSLDVYGRELNQLQKVELVRCALEGFGKLENDVRQDARG